MAIDLGTFPPERLMELLERTKIEQTLRQELSWRVYQEPDEMMRWELIPYNTCVAAHAHRASRGLPPEKSLMRFWGTHGGTPQFAAKVGYKHNQAAVVGCLKDDPDVEVAKLHIAAANDDAIYLQEIVLADPTRRPRRPMGPDQEYAGLGNGIFGAVLSNVRNLAAEHQRDKVILYAVDRTRAAVFARKGFNLDLDEPELIALSKLNGIQIPMVSRAP